MDGRDVAWMQKPPWRLAAGVTAAFTVGIICLRLSIYPDRIIPLSYALPLLIGLWHRDRILLWTMAGCFLVVVVVKDVWIAPDGFFDGLDQQILFTVMQCLNVAVPAAVVHLVLNFRQGVERSTESLASTNAELESGNEELAASNEELAVREEEISRQNEELQSQAEELEQQAEELRIQTEELQGVNEELAGRESTLQMLLRLSGPAADESELLEQLCETAPKLLGENVRSGGLGAMRRPVDGARAFGV